MRTHQVGHTIGIGGAPQDVDAVGLAADSPQPAPSRLGEQGEMFTEA
jgi:hypothetical protein